MKKIILFLYLLLFFNTIQSQEIVGLDMRVEALPEPYLDEYRNLVVEFYLESQDTIEMDSFYIFINVTSLTFDLPKKNHFFFDNDIQMLMFKDTIVFNGSGGSSLIGTDTLGLPEIVNLDGILVGQYSMFYNFYYYYATSGSDPIPNRLLTEVIIENGVVRFDASCIDPDGSTLYYYLRDNISPNYKLPQGTHPPTIDSITGEFEWDRPTIPGKYLIIIDVQEHSNLSGMKRYLILDIKEEDIVPLPTTEKERLPFTISPNPTTQKITIDIPEQLPVNRAELKLYNTLGHCVFEKQIVQFGTVEIDVAGWPSGVYVATLEAGGQVWTEKVVVRR